jgi:hypothetical protein
MRQKALPPHTAEREAAAPAEMSQAHLQGTHPRLRPNLRIAASPAHFFVMNPEPYRCLAKYD